MLKLNTVFLEKRKKIRNYNWILTKSANQSENQFWHVQQQKVKQKGNGGPDKQAGDFIN